MKKLIYVTAIGILLLLSSCGKKKEIQYYKTGQIQVERIFENKNDTSRYESIYYYKTGHIKSKGYIVNNLRNGQWQDWYIDGTTKWVGEYENNTRKIITVKTLPRIEFNDSVLNKGKQTYLRLRVEGIHPENTAIACNKGIIRVSDKKDLFDYIVIPKEEGIMSFIIYLKTKEGMTEIGADSIFVYPN